MSRRSKPGKVDAVAALYWQIEHMSRHILPLPTTEFVFHEKRKWRFDLCWPGENIRVGIEIDGGIWSRERSGHQGAGHIRDLRKGNDAILSGYRVLHFIPEDIIGPGGRHNLVALETVIALFKTLGFKEKT